jgi:ribonuclease BN (tRNA processing enzyme)
LKVKFLGTHNAETHNTRLISLVIDDYLAIDAGSLSSELTYIQQTKIKAVLLTHGHYDHIRDIPAFAFNNTSRLTEVYALPQTIRILKNNLMDGQIYPEFESDSSYLGKAILDLLEIQPGITFDLSGYQILPVSVNHPLPAVGFQIGDKEGKKFFYSGDTGPGLASVWQQISPQLMLMDVTFPDKLESVSIASGHLSPGLLKKDLLEFKRIKGYLPDVMAIHLAPQFEKDIQYELEGVSGELGVPIGIAHEGEVKALH